MSEMNSDQLMDAMIIDSWRKNAISWTVAVRQGQIESRTLITNQAIVNAVLSCSPHSVLDIGCGEGWLARELAASEIKVAGIDVAPDLIEQARIGGGGDFQVLSHEDLTAGKLKACVDLVVCNFALFGRQSVDGLFKVIPSLLKPQGSLVIQTLHPLMACGDFPYLDGWRTGSWAGFSAEFTDPAPWYFRTMESWVKLFLDSGFRLLEIREPVHPLTRQPASVIFIAGRAG
jgi:2-polyprenyl-3-methyl-5-hydroxy-6-metoxy-1,4-benzoquinol methylase